MSSTAKKLFIAAASVIFGAVLLLGGLYVYTTDFSFRPQPFVAEVWRAGDAKLRGTMVTICCGKILDAVAMLRKLLRCWVLRIPLAILISMGTTI